MSAPQRQWMQFSLQEDNISVEPLPSPPHALAPSYLQAVDLDVGFFQKSAVTNEVYAADDIAKTFAKQFSDMLLNVGEVFLLEYHGQTLKAAVKSLALYNLAEEQQKGGRDVRKAPGHSDMGVLFGKTDITVMKASDSPIKLKSSSKK